MRWLVAVSLFAALLMTVNAVDKDNERSDDERLLQLLRRLQDDLEQRDSAAGDKVEEVKAEEKKEERVHLPVEKDEKKEVEKEQPADKSVEAIEDAAEESKKVEEKKTERSLKADSTRTSDPAGDILPYVMESLIQLLNDALNLTLSHVPPKSGAVEAVERRRRQADEVSTTPAPQPASTTTSPAPSTPQSNPIVYRMLQKLGEVEYCLAIIDYFLMYPPTQTGAKSSEKRIANPVDANVDIFVGDPSTSSRSKLGVAHLLETHQKRSQPLDADKTDGRVELAKLLDKYAKR